MLSILFVAMTFAMTFSSIFMVVRFGKATAISALTAIISPVTIYWIYCALDSSRNINLMLAGHALFLRRQVAEHKIHNIQHADSKQRGGWKTQEGLMLQFAEVIERQPFSETIASFPVTSHLAVIVVGFLGLPSFINF